MEYTNANQQIIAESHVIRVQDMESEQDGHYNTCDISVHSFWVLYSSWTPPIHILQLQKCPTGRRTMLIFSTPYKKIQWWILQSQSQEYIAVTPIRWNDLYCCTDCVGGFTLIVKQINKIQLIPIVATLELAHFVGESCFRQNQ